MSETDKLGRVTDAMRKALERHPEGSKAAADETERILREARRPQR